MTVIAWDGETLAADRRATSGGGIARTVTKIQKHGDVLLGVTGNWDVAAEMREWFKAGAVPADFPAKARDGDATLIVIRRSGIETFIEGPYSMPLEEEKAAWGSGRDYAEATMYLGGSAVQGVQVASHFQTDCGNGFDTLTLDD
jgi:ATP-dependent protease HslVU (ClpYQ) peptidase subunit